MVATSAQSTVFPQGQCSTDHVAYRDAQAQRDEESWQRIARREESRSPATAERRQPSSKGEFAGLVVVPCGNQVSVLVDPSHAVANPGRGGRRGLFNKVPVPGFGDVHTRYCAKKVRIPGAADRHFQDTEAPIAPIALELCAGVPIPATFTGVTADQLKEVRGGIRFPCVVKPERRDDRWDRLFSPNKGLVASNDAELRAALAEAARAETRLMVQEVIPGPDSELYFSHAYFGADTEVQAMWTGHKVRQLPIHFGTSTLAETLHVKEVADYTTRLLQPLPQH